MNDDLLYSLKTELALSSHKHMLRIRELAFENFGQHS